MSWKLVGVADLLREAALAAIAPKELTPCNNFDLTVQ